MFKKVSFIKTTTTVIIGSVVYKLCVAIAISFGLNSSDLKMITASLFLIILVISRDGSKNGRFNYGLTDKIVNEKKPTTIMVTHNLRYAVEYGNRLIMMHQGEIVIDRDDEEKKNIGVDNILDKFNEISKECGN